MSSKQDESASLIGADGHAESNEIDTNHSRPAFWGMTVIAIGVGGFLLWATLAPLDAGIVASATVNVTNNRKTIQHLAGGTVDAILVREGESIRQGQPLLRLNGTKAIAEQGVLTSQYIVAKSVEDRLEAERDGRDAIHLSPELLNRFRGDPRLDEALMLQQRLFTTRRAALTGEVDILRENLHAAEQQLAGLSQVQSMRSKQVKFVTQQLEGLRSLAAEGYLPRNRLLELERNAAELNGSLAEDIANVGRTRNQIAELKLRILQCQQDYQKDLQSQLTDVQKEVSSLVDRLRAVDYEVANTEIRSPIDGVVLGLAVTTIGGVIQPGAHIMDIVPANEPLQVNAMVPVQAIDKMVPDLPVDISFPAFNHAQTPTIPGRVLTVAADRMMDEVSKQPYYLAQVVVTPEGMKLLGTNRIRAGMPATVTIKTGERSLLSYLLKPLNDRLDGAFKEQ